MKRESKEDKALGAAIEAALRKRTWSRLRDEVSIGAPSLVRKEGDVGLTEVAVGALIPASVCSTARMFRARTSAAGTSNGLDDAVEDGDVGGLAENDMTKVSKVWDLL